MSINDYKIRNYWMSGDDRNGNTILFRRADHLKDYCGKTNQWPKDGDEFDRMIEWHERFEEGAKPFKEVQKSDTNKVERKKHAE